MGPPSVHRVGAVHVGRWRPAPVTHEHRGSWAVLTGTATIVTQTLVIYSETNESEMTDPHSL